eukprot:g51108.t1
MLRAGSGSPAKHAFVITCSLFFLITLFVLQTKVQFSFLHAGIFAALWIISIWDFAAAVAGLQPGWWWAVIGAITATTYRNLRQISSKPQRLKDENEKIRRNLRHLT